MNMFKHVNIRRSGTLITLLVIASFLVGVWAGGYATTTLPLVRTVVFPQHNSGPLNFALLEDVWDVIKRDYAGESVNDETLFYGALSGMVQALGDPYSQFFTPQGVEELRSELAGTFEGIGAEIGVRDGGIVVIAPLPQSPAQRAGLVTGDRILAIDNESTDGMALDIAVSKIRGAQGSTVTLSIGHQDGGDPQDVEIVRDTIKLESVTWQRESAPGAGNDLALITLNHFNSDTAARVKGIANEIAAMNPRGIILDLRNNPGGFLDSAVDVSSAWVGDKVVVREEGKSGETEHKGTNSATLSAFPTVVLINGGSASAAEIVAGALQDWKVATLVGDTTFGKGTVQELESLGNDAAVKLTVATWLTPLGRAINKTGIAPDVQVARSREDIDAGRDPQLDKAIEILSHIGAQ